MALSLVLLCGCSGENRAMKAAMELRTQLLERGCRFTAEIEAHPDDGTAAFTLSCACDPAGNVTLEVTAPESIAGITATVEPGARQARFEDVALDFGLLANGQLAPMAIPQLLYGAWTGEYIREAGADGDRLTAVYLSGWGDRELVIEQWLGPDAAPVYADLWCGARNAASVKISDFVLGGEEEALQP